MPRVTRNRQVGAEANLAARIQFERTGRGWSYETLAKQMTDAGCPITASALHRVEKGQPPRRVTVDELVTLASIFDLAVSDLLRPVDEVLDSAMRRAVQDYEKALKTMGIAVGALISATRNAVELADSSRDFNEFFLNHMAARPTFRDALAMAKLRVMEGGTAMTPQTEHAIWKAFDAVTEAALTIVDSGEGDD